MAIIIAVCIFLCFLHSAAELSFVMLLTLLATFAPMHSYIYIAVISIFALLLHLHVHWCCIYISTIVALIFALLLYLYLQCCVHNCNVDIFKWAWLMNLMNYRCILYHYLHQYRCCPYVCFHVSNGVVFTLHCYIFTAFTLHCCCIYISNAALFISALLINIYLMLL